MCYLPLFFDGFASALAKEATCATQISRMSVLRDKAAFCHLRSSVRFGYFVGLRRARKMMFGGASELTRIVPAKLGRAFVAYLEPGKRHRRNTAL